MSAYLEVGALRVTLPTRRGAAMPLRGVEVFRRELVAAHEEGGLFQLLMHPHVIGYRPHIWILDEILRLAKSLGDVWFCTHQEIAEWLSAKCYGF